MCGKKGKERKGNGWGVRLHVVTSVYVFFVWHETRVRVLSNIDSKLCGLLQVLRGKKPTSL